MMVYLKNALLDWLLCVVVSSGLAYTALSGFYSTQPYQDLVGTLATIGVSAGVLAVLFLISANRKVKVIAGIAFSFVALGIFAVAVATSTVENPMDDAVGNNLDVALCMVLPPLFTFLLSRTRPACVVLIVMSVLFCGVIEYLYWYGHVIAFLLVLTGEAALYVYRTYQASLLNSESEHLAFGSVTVMGIALALVAVGVGFGVHAAFIAPMEPPHMVVKLITEHYRAEEKEVRGIGSTDDIQNDEQTNEENDETTQTNEKTEDDTGMEIEEDQGAPAQDSSLFGALGAGLAALTMNFPEWWPFASVVIFVALVAAAIIAKKMLRRRQYRAMLAKGGNGAVSDLYRFFLNRFARFKIPQPGTLTLQEYAAGFSDTFKKFEQRIDEPTFTELTRVYARQAYGGEDVSDEELATFEGYYGAFYKRACKYVGWFKYCRLFFRI